MLEEEELENQYLLIEALSERYPQMLLSPPLLPEEVESYVRGMNSYEREFVKILQNRGLIVFREPELITTVNQISLFITHILIKGKL